MPSAPNDASLFPVIVEFTNWAFVDEPSAAADVTETSPPLRCTAPLSPDVFPENVLESDEKLVTWPNAPTDHPSRRSCPQRRVVDGDCGIVLGVEAAAAVAGRGVARDRRVGDPEREHVVGRERCRLFLIALLLEGAAPALGGVAGEGRAVKVAVAVAEVTCTPPPSAPSSTAWLSVNVEPVVVMSPRSRCRRRRSTRSCRLNVTPLSTIGALESISRPPP